MARPGLKDHPKFRRACYLLNEPVPHVWGYLECLWLVGYQNGNDVIGDEIDIELAAQYPGEQGKLCKVLLQCGLIDKLESGKYAIHDLLNNAPDYVRRRMSRESERKRKGVDINTLRSEAGKKGAGSRWQDSDGESPDPSSQRMANDGHLPSIGDRLPQNAGQRLANGATPRERERDTEEKERQYICEPEPEELSPTANEFLEAWNSVPGVCRAQKISDKRLSHFIARRADPFWRENWRAVLDSIPKKPFLVGGGNRGWQITIDNFLKPDTLTKILEGQYDDKSSRPTSRPMGSNHSRIRGEIPKMPDASEEIGSSQQAESGF